VSRNNDASLVIFGNGPDKNRLMTLVDSFQLDKRVIFFDAVPNAHQYNYFFDLFAIPSKHEGFGLSLVEAALHKKSIICSDIDVFRELFNEEEVTFFNLLDYHSIDTAVIKALELKNKGPLARDKARKKYSISNMVDSYEQEYIEILKEQV
jgi:glycosyltransferase involved in cell wall biosynthesis